MIDDEHRGRSGDLLATRIASMSASDLGIKRSNYERASYTYVVDGKVKTAV